MAPEVRTEAGQVMVSRWGAIDLGSTRDSFARAVATIEAEAIATERARIVTEVEKAPSWDGAESFVMVKAVFAIVNGDAS